MKMIHKLLIGAGLVVVLLVAGGLWLYSSLDSLVAQAIRKYGSEITGVAVKLDSVKLVPAEGKGSLRGFSVGNPRGFEAPTAFRVSDINLELDVATLTSDVVVIRRIDITGPDITYELGPNGNNFDAIQRNIERSLTRMVGASKEAKDGKGGGKKVIIDHLVIRQGRVEARSHLLKDQKLSATLPEIVVRDIGRKSNGATSAEVVRQIWGPLQQQVLKSVANLNLGGAADLLKKGGGTDAVRGLFK
jgi:hypothetical protein